MSDLFGNQIVGFPTRRLNYACLARFSTRYLQTALVYRSSKKNCIMRTKPVKIVIVILINEPTRGKTSNVVSERV